MYLLSFSKVLRRTILISEYIKLNDRTIKYHFLLFISLHLILKKFDLLKTFLDIYEGGQKSSYDVIIAVDDFFD